MKNKLKGFSFWAKFLGLLLFCFLIYKIGWKDTLNSIKKVSIIHIIIPVMVLWVGYYLKSFRWKIVSNAYQIPLKNYQAFKVFFIGIFLANITPGKLGDFARLLYIKDHLPSQKIGWSSLIMDRLFDIVSLLVFSGIALVYYQCSFRILKFPVNYWTMIFWFLGIVLFFVVLFRFRKKIKSKVAPFIEAFSAHDLSFWKKAQAFMITCLSMILIYGVFNYVAWAMGIQINQIGLFLGSFVLGILSLLPITVLGIGVRETSLVVIFQLYLLPPEDAIALSLIIFLLQLISIVPGAIWFYLSPIQLADLKQMK